MSDLTPRQPERPFFWPDILLDLQELVADIPDEVYVVGGGVRDAYLHRPLKDIDLSTSGGGMRLARKIANRYNGDFFPLDVERDVGRALVDTPEGRLMFDVAHFRGADLLVDLTDRDFTMNAMAVDLHADLSRLIDPLGGERDILAKLLRRCTPDALAQDSIRTLRAIRQSVQLGMRIEPDTLADVRRVAPQLTTASAERVRDEFLKLLALPRPAAACRIAERVGVLKFVLPEVEQFHSLQPSNRGDDGWAYTLRVVDSLSNILALIDSTRTDNIAASFTMGMVAIQLDRYRPQLQEHIAVTWPNERPHRALLVLAALMHNVGGEGVGAEPSSGDIADVRASALRLSNTERERLVKIVQYYRLPLDIGELNPRIIHRFWRELGEAGLDVCLLSLAVYLATYHTQIKQVTWLGIVDCIRILLEAYYERYETLIAPLVLVDGNQLIETFHLRPGPVVGQLLGSHPRGSGRW